MAFRWVAENITAFGGDPENITAFGESSGAGNISDWAIAEMAKDSLFRRSIMQSSAGSLQGRRTLAAEQKTGAGLIDSLRLEGELTAERLREIPAEELLAAAESELGQHYFEAVIDGLTMKGQPIESLDRADKTSTDILIGTNKDEWYMYIDEDSTREDLAQWVKENAPESAETLLAEVHTSSPTPVRRRLCWLWRTQPQTYPSMAMMPLYFDWRVAEPLQT